MNVTQNQLFESLRDSNNILIAGAGGGFDVCAGVPLFLALQKSGKKVHFANLSFASLRNDGNQINDCCFEVTALTAGSETYFPERVLCRWFERELNQTIRVFAFPQTGVVPLRESYRQLVETLELDAVVLVDGGTDSLMRGDEAGLGTPSEDVASLAAVNGVEVDTKLLVCLGFGVDRFHGVCHAQFLEAVASLTQENAFLGAFTLLPNTDEARHYLSLTDYAGEETATRPSIVNTSIASAVEGRFGNYHATNRTRGSKLWISPLMAMYWSFELSAVYQRNLYVEWIEDSQTMYEISNTIRRFREVNPIRDWEAIPD